jgi:hypothetical protein
MSESPTPRPLNRTQSMKIFEKADPTVKRVVKDCLKEERQVMNMIRRDSIHVNLVNIVKAHTNTN